MLRTAVTACLFALACLLAAPVPADGREERRRDDAHEHARDAVRRGSYVPLEGIIGDAERRFPGRVIEVELDDDDDEYEIEILLRDGRVVELVYDARTGRLLEVEFDDD